MGGEEVISRRASAAHLLGAVLLGGQGGLAAGEAVGGVLQALAGVCV